MTFAPDAKPTPGGHVPSLAASLMISQNGEAPNPDNLDSICTSSIFIQFFDFPAFKVAQSPCPYLSAEASNGLQLFSYGFGQRST
jgi:hypothetical protein